MQELIELVKIGGPAVTTVGIFCWYLDRQDKRINQMICNHFQHVTEAINHNTEVLSILVTLIKKLNGKKK